MYIFFFILMVITPIIRNDELGKSKLNYHQIVVSNELIGILLTVFIKSRITLLIN